jgi:heavy metal efflux system protein
MISSILKYGLSHRTLVVIAAVLLIALGIFSYSKIHLEAFPDPTPIIIDVSAQAPGLSAEQIETYYTIPLETAVFPIAQVDKIRSTSFQGLSWIQITFKPEADYYTAYNLTAVALEQMPSLLGGVVPIIQQSSPLGEVIQYQVHGPKELGLTNLRTIQDWLIARRLKTIPGVVQVNSWGGATKQFSINVSAEKLIKYNVTLDQIIKATNNSNMNIGGREITIGQQSTNIRGIGLIDDGGASDLVKGVNVSDIENIAIKSINGIPVQIKDVGSVKVGYEPRLGIVGVNHDDDGVTGTIVIGRMFHASDILPKIDDEFKNINESGLLPPGVYIDKYYDRTDLADAIRDSIFLNIFLGIVIVFLIQWLLIGDYRAALIVCANVPFSYAVALIILYLRNEETNLLSVSAIDFGIIIDSSVILVENIFYTFHSSRAKRLDLLQSLSEGKWGEDPSSPTNISGSYRRWTEGIRLLYVSTLQVSDTILFATIVTIVTFLPIFLMPGNEAYLFGPIARGYCYALIGSFFSTIIFTPVFASIALPKNIEEVQHGIFLKFKKRYLIILKASIDNARQIVGVGIALVLFCVILASQIGVDFIPTLEEQNIFIKATLPRSISLEAGIAPIRQIREIIMRHPEVDKVVSHLGRPDNGSEPFAFNNAQFLVVLKSMSKFTGLDNKNRLRDDIAEELRRETKGIIFSHSQYIEESIDAATYGISSENGIRIFGKKIEEVEAAGQKINDEIVKVAGVYDVEVMHSIGQQNLDIKIDREKAARYGLNTNDIASVIKASVGGEVASLVYESDRVFDLVVRFEKEDRNSIENIYDLPINFVATSDGSTSFIPLKEIADIQLVTGSSFIYRDSSRKNIAIRFSVRNRDLDSAVKEIKYRIAKNIILDHDINIKWEGDSVYLGASYRYLWFMSLVSFILVYVVLFSLFSSSIDGLVSLIGVPFMVGGGIVSLYISGNEFSIPSAIGFISLIGIATMDGIFNIVSIRQLNLRGVSLRDAVFYSAEQRVRPMLLTSLSAAAGLLPAIIVNDIGSNIQRPIAIVVVGGCLFGTVVLLIVAPAIRVLLLEETISSSQR